MSGDVVIACASCHEPLLPDDLFCEACGAAVAGADAPAPAPERCHGCGAPASAIGPDGYCSVCGVRPRGPVDRSEADLVVAAAISDQGRVHRRNEDAFFLERVGDDEVAVVICDGISSSQAGDQAAAAAAAAAGAVLADGMRAGAADDLALLGEAVAAAQGAVGAVPWTSRADAAVPSSTLVSAVVRADRISISWLGDSRAYWIADDGSRLLTVDHSWAAEQVAEGRMSEQEALADARAHAITRWLGLDAAHETPDTAYFATPGPGRLLLCSDGLWNYAPDPEDLARRIDELPAGAAPMVVARSLVDLALVAGGRDNITVAVVDVRPDRRSST